MDISVTTQSGSTPQPAQTQPAAVSQAGAVGTLQSAPENVVTPAVSPSETNVREEDAFRRPANPSRDAAVASLQSLELSGLQTRVGFDAEREEVFLEILRPGTSDVIQRIPSEGLIEFLSEQFDQLSGTADGGVPPVDTSA